MSKINKIVSLKEKLWYFQMKIIFRLEKKIKKLVMVRSMWKWSSITINVT